MNVGDTGLYLDYCLRYLLLGMVTVLACLTLTVCSYLTCIDLCRGGAVCHGCSHASKFLLTDTLTALHGSLSWAEFAFSNLKEEEGGDMHPDKV